MKGKTVYVYLDKSGKPIYCYAVWDEPITLIKVMKYLGRIKGPIKALWVSDLPKEIPEDYIVVPCKKLYSLLIRKGYLLISKKAIRRAMGERGETPGEHLLPQGSSPSHSRRRSKDGRGS